MKNKVIIILLFVLLFLTSSCSNDNSKQKQKKMIGTFEIKSQKLENVDGTLKIKITLKNKSKKTKKIPVFYIKLIDKNELEIACIDNSVVDNVNSNQNYSFEINTDVQYSVVKKIKYETTK